MTYAVNHLGHFYLTHLLMPKLRESSRPECRSRLVIVSSLLHAHSGIPADWPMERKLARLIPPPPRGGGLIRAFRLYSTSKLCNVLMALKLDRDVQWCGGVNTYVLHPGNIPATQLGKNSSGGALGSASRLAARLPYMKSVEQGAATTVHCAVSPDVENVSVVIVSGRVINARSSELREVLEELSRR